MILFEYREVMPGKRLVITIAAVFVWTASEGKTLTRRPRAQTVVPVIIAITSSINGVVNVFLILEISLLRLIMIECCE